MRVEVTHPRRSWRHLKGRRGRVIWIGGGGIVVSGIDPWWREKWAGYRLFKATEITTVNRDGTVYGKDGKPINKS